MASLIRDVPPVQGIDVCQNACRKDDPLFLLLWTQPVCYACPRNANFDCDEVLEVKPISFTRKSTSADCWTSLTWFKRLDARSFPTHADVFLMLRGRRTLRRPLRSCSHYRQIFSWPIVCKEVAEQLICGGREDVRVRLSTVSLDA